MARRSKRMKAAHLTKSLFQSGRQCRKRLWLEVRRRELMTWDVAAQSRVDDGNYVGKLAREQFGVGFGDEQIQTPDSDFEKALAQTKALLAQPPTHRPVLFEAAFEHAGVRIRIDAFMRFPMADRLIEVKAGSVPKDDYLWDCAIQTWVMRGAGRPVSLISLALVDKHFVYESEGDYRGLLTLDDCTEQVEALLPHVPALVADFKAVIAGPMPEVSTGRHCSKPYDCPFHKHCRAYEPPPPDYPIADLPSAGVRLLASLRAAGFSDLREVPLGELKNPRHRRVASAARTGTTYVSDDFAPLLDWLDYPRYYLDFETISFVVPRWVNTRPNQQVVFQFSCHIEQSDGTLSHYEFLDITGNDPSSNVVLALLETMGQAGPILVWNKSFEVGRLEELAAMFPGHAKALHDLIERVVDLLDIYRDHYYHRDMHGSWSVKKVLPTVAPELDYKTLAIGDGDMAQVAYRRAIAAETSAEAQQAIHKNLLAYCRQDTLAMVRLARWRPE